MRQHLSLSLILSLLWVLLLLALAAWWLSLIVSLGSQLDQSFFVHGPVGGSDLPPRLAPPVHHPFFTSTLKTSAKPGSGGPFMPPSLTNSKTPLASMRLQADVIDAKVTHTGKP